MNTALHPSDAEAEHEAAPGPGSTGYDVDPSLPGLSFTGTLKSEFIKLMALRTTWWLSGITLVTGVLIAVAVAFSFETVDAASGEGQTDPVTLASQGVAGIYFAMILLGAMGAIAITTEFSSGAIRSALTAAPKRHLLIAAKGLALAVWTGLVSAVLVLVSHLAVAMIAEPLNPGAIVTEPDVAISYLTSWAAVVLTAIMGFGLGALLRSSAGAIVSLAIILFVVQIGLTIMWGVSDGAAWAEALMRIEYMFLVGEFTSPGDMAGMQVPFGPEPLQRWQAGLGMLIWAGLPLAAGWLSFTRRDS